MFLVIFCVLQLCNNRLQSAVWIHLRGYTIKKQPASEPEHIKPEGYLTLASDPMVNEQTRGA
jgi:hypothetical protein